MTNQLQKKLTLQNFQQINKQKNQQKLVQQALVYLKLRQHNCPKSRALSFAKKKIGGVDTTKQKDGPAGFRLLKPYKPQGKIINGWLKGQKLSYEGLKGFSEQAKISITKQKKSISKYNQTDRIQFQNWRKNQKYANKFLVGPQQRKEILHQIGSIKDQFVRERQKKSFFLSYDGVKLDQFTKNFFETIQKQDPKSLILKLKAFQTPLNNQKIQFQSDLEVSKGHSMNAHQIQGQIKRKQVINFRRSLTNLQMPKQNKQQKKFRSTLYNFKRSQSHKQMKKKYEKTQKQLQQFYKDLQKYVWLKTKNPEHIPSNDIQI